MSVLNSTDKLMQLHYVYSKCWSSMRGHIYKQAKHVCSAIRPSQDIFSQDTDRCVGCSMYKRVKLQYTCTITLKHDVCDAV